MSPLGVAFRIVADIAAYRLAKREMANLVTSMTLGLALRLPPADLAYRFLFAFLLNVWVYLVNDCIDVEIDLQAPGRDQKRVRFLADHLRAAWVVVGVLSAALIALGALHSIGLLVAFGATAPLIVAYTRVLKRRPIADLAAMFGWGLSMALAGFPIDSRDGWALAGLLGILCAITEAVQVLRDAPSDRAAGVRTTAVVIGEAWTARIARALVFAAGAYSVLLLHRWVGLAFALAVLVPLRVDRAARSWDALRVVFGTTWLALLAAYWHGGRLEGLLP